MVTRSIVEDVSNHIHGNFERIAGLIDAYAIKFPTEEARASEEAQREKAQIDELIHEMRIIARAMEAKLNRF